MTCIELKGLNFSYGNGEKVLRNVDLRIDEPGFYCIIGPNGVGKSTIAKCIDKINEPPEGSVFIDGRDVRHMTLKEIAKVISFVPAFSEDVFSMSVIDTILIGRHNHARWGSRNLDLEKVYRVMKMLQIEDLAYKNSNALSAGQRQKVLIARGLVQDTPVLILDEPTANLDIRYQIYVMELLRAISEKRGMIVLTISHDLNITSKYAHQVIMMEYPGVVHSVGEASDVITEQDIEQVYGVRCRVVESDTGGSRPDGKLSIPHIILDEAIIDRPPEDPEHG